MALAPLASGVGNEESPEDASLRGVGKLGGDDPLTEPYSTPGASPLRPEGESPSKKPSHTNHTKGAGGEPNSRLPRFPYMIHAINLMKGAEMAKTFEEMVAEARRAADQRSVEEVREAMKSGEQITILDVREPAEWEDAHITEAKLIPRGLLEYMAADELPDKEALIVVHCATGGRSALAAKTLKEMGYENAANMDGGITAWRERGYEVE
ncbi:MAG: rhodanese-like domain-containing protein [Rubrobacteraceae bacterium]